MSKGVYSKLLQKKIFSFYSQNVEQCDQSYEDANDNKIMNLYEIIMDEKIKNILLAKTSIILLTANKYERNILHKRINKLTSKKIKQFKINLLTACEPYSEAYAYSFEWNNNYYLHIHANVTGSYAIGGSADIIRWIRSNNYLFPKLIISFGICFGTDSKKNNIGDVFISDKIYPYFIGAKINENKSSGKIELYVVDDNAFKISGKIYNRIKNLQNNNLFENLPFKVDLKSFITGEAVVSSQTARDIFDKTTTQLTPAGEMEGYGVFKECNYSDFKIPCLIVKSICDWGVEKNFDSTDENSLKMFKEIYNGENNKNISDKSASKIIETLKDRLQAYSSDCAFATLNVITEEFSEDISLFENLQSWIINYNGAAITCNEIIEKANEMVQKLNITCKELCCFVKINILNLVDEYNGQVITTMPMCDREDCHRRTNQVTVYKDQLNSTGRNEK